MTTALKKSPAEAAAAEDGLFWESKIAKTLGLSRERVRTLREEHLAPDEWITRGNAVVLTARGLEKITALAAAGAGPGNEDGVEAGPPAAARLVVAKLCGNLRLLLARAKAGGPGSPLVLVRVKTNEHFMAGMEFDALPTSAGWQFVGRLPRRKGRW